MTVDAVATHLRTTSRTVLRHEAGQANIRQSDLERLLDLYAVPHADRPELVTLAREARQPGWWTPVTSSVRPTFATFLGLEDGATSYSEYAAVVIPGLLQTEDYMRAIMNAAVPRLSDATIDERIAVRRKRQDEMLARGTPYHFVVDEACLMRRVGSVAVMAEQLQHLHELSKKRLITIQILEFLIGAHASVLGGYTILTFDGMPSVAYVELVAGDLYADGPDADRYSLHFDKLREGASPEPHSRRTIDRIRKDVHHEP